MFRIVFYYSTVLVLVLGTFVYSKPHDLNESNNGENFEISKIQYVPNSEPHIEQHEIIVEDEEPAIFDISTQVAKFILYFIKKYCKNGNNIEYLQKLLSTKGIGSIFKTNTDGNIQPNFSYFESSPQQIESTIPKQGHAIKYTFATAPSHELPNAIETKQNELINRRIETTTQNIQIFKQYQTPLIQIQQQQQPSHYFIETQQPKYLNTQNEKQKNIEFKIHQQQQQPHYGILSKQHKSTIEMKKPKIELRHHEVLTVEPEIFEPMYDYASHGDEYGITENEYNLPDYDFPDNKQIKINEPVFEENPNIRRPVIHEHIESFTEKPIFQIPTIEKHEGPETTNPQIFLKNHEEPITHELTLPKLDTEKPEILDTFYNLFTSTIEPEKRKMNIEHTTIKQNTYNFKLSSNEPKIHQQASILPIMNENLYNFPIPKEEPKLSEEQKIINVEPKIEQDNWFSIPDYKHQQPEFQKPHFKESTLDFTMPNFQINAETSQPENWLEHNIPEQKIDVPTVHFVNHEKTDINEPLIQKHTFDNTMPHYELNADVKAQDDWLKLTLPEHEHEPEIKTPTIHFANHEQPNLNEPLVKEHTFDLSLPHYELNSDVKHPKTDKFFTYKLPEMKEVMPQVGGSHVHFINNEPQMKEHTFDFETTDKKEPDNWFNLQEKNTPKFGENTQVYFMNHAPDMKHPQMSMSNKQPGNWFKFSSPEFKHEPIMNQESHTFDYSIPNYDSSKTQKPNDWFHSSTFHEEKVPHINKHFMHQEHPQIKEHTIDYSIPSLKIDSNTQQPDNSWFKFSTPETEKHLINIKHPKIHSDTQQPPNGLLKLKQDTVPQKMGQSYVYSIPKYDDTSSKTQQPDNSWFKFSTPETEKHLINIKHPQIDYSIPNLKINSNTQEPDSWFKFSTPEVEHVKIETPNYEMNLKTQQPDIWYKHSMPESKQEISMNMGTPTIHKTFEYSSPGHEHQVNLKSETENWMFQQNNGADTLYKKYTIELENLDNMKPHYKQIISASKYGQFAKNLNEMKDVLSVWKNGGHFYEQPTIDYVTNTMTKLSSDTLDLLQIDDDITTTEDAGDLGSRRTFDGAEELTKYLEGPTTRDEFNSLDVLLQNAILSYHHLSTEEKPTNEALLILLHKIKFMMARYKNLFNKLKWIDGAIEHLNKDTTISPEMLKIMNNPHELLKDNWELVGRLSTDIKQKFDDNSKMFLALLDVPVTVQSRPILINIIQKLLKDIVASSKTEPQFKDVKFFMGAQKHVDKSPLFKHMKQLVASPEDLIASDDYMEELLLDNRRSNSEEDETETTTEIVVITTQPTPKKKIEKHHNIFREFLMNADE